MKKVLSILAVSAFLFSANANAQQEPKKAESKKECSSKEKKSCSSKEKKGGCCSHKKAEEKKAE